MRGFQNSPRPGGRAGPGGRGSSFGLETLEGRWLMSSVPGGSVWLDRSGTLRIRGDSVAPNRVAVRSEASEVSVWLNGHESRFAVGTGLRALRIEGGRGDDRIELDASLSAVVLAKAGADVVRVLTGTAHVLGGPGEDVLIGGPGADTLAGGDGHDVVFGLEGVNRLTGGAGNDTLAGGPDSEFLDGGAGRDLIEPGGGRDRVLRSDGVAEAPLVPVLEAGWTGAALPIPPAGAATPPAMSSLPIRVAKWQDLPLEGGGAIQAIAVSPHDPNVLLAGVDVAGAFRSTDGGRTWKTSWLGLGQSDADFAVADVTFDPSRPGVAWLAAGKTWSAGTANSSDLYRSTNNGVTWVRVNGTSGSLSFNGQYDGESRQRGKVIWVDPANPDRLVLGTTMNGIRVSTNGGTSFALAGGTSAIDNVSALVGDPTRPGVLLATLKDTDKSGSTGILRSADGGTTFTPVVSGVSMTDVAVSGDGSAIAAGPGGILRSTDGGLTWADASAGFNLGSGLTAQFISVAADPFVAGRFLAGAHSSSAFSHPKLFARTGTGSWAPAFSDVNTAYTPYGVAGVDGWQAYKSWFAAAPSAITFHPTRAGWVYIGDWYGVQTSSDGGSTWRATYKGLRTVVVRDSAWSPWAPGRAYLGVHDVGLHEWWETDPTPGNPVNPGGQVRSMRDTYGSSHADTRTLGDRVLVETYGYEADTGSNVTLHLLTSESVRVSRTITAPSAERRLVGNTDADVDTATGRIIASTRNGMLVTTTDGGLNWTSLNTTLPEPGQPIDAVSFLPGSPGRWVITFQNNTVYQASAGLTSWARLTSWPGKVRADVSGNLYGVMGATETVVKSTDNGVTWTPILTGADEVAVATQGRVWAGYSVKNGGPSQIAYSADGGATWVRLNSPGYRQGVFLSPDPLNPDRALIGIPGIGFWLATVT